MTAFLPLWAASRLRLLPWHASPLPASGHLLRKANIDHPSQTVPFYHAQPLSALILSCSGITVLYVFIAFSL